MTQRKVGLRLGSTFVALLTAGCLEDPGCGPRLSCLGQNRGNEDIAGDGGNDGGAGSAAVGSDGSAPTGEPQSTSPSFDASSISSSSEASAEVEGGSTIAAPGAPDSGVCGDGAFGGGEACDDGNTEDEIECPYGQATCVACNSTCNTVLRLTGPTCGDGVVSDEEACDENVEWCQACSVVPRIAAGGAHSCASLRDGTVKCWGSGAYGQLGNNGTVDQTTPVSVAGIGSNVTGVAAGFGHSCAVRSDGIVKCWGSDSDGQLGNGTASGEQSTPVDVLALEGSVSAISAGDSHSCALLSDRTVKCWGRGADGQLGNGSNDSKSAAVSVAELDSVVAIASGGAHNCALLSDHTVRCWGWGIYGQLGDGRGTTSATPVRVEGLDADATAIAAGGRHTCAILANGGIKCWGSGIYGQLGDGATNNQSVPVNVSTLGGSAVEIVAAGFHTCSRLTAGAVKCWGSGTDGELGNGGSETHTTPVTVTGIDGATTVIAAGERHNCALLDDGGVKCWGSGTNGQLGNGRFDDQTVPVTVIGLP